MALSAKQKADLLATVPTQPQPKPAAPAARVPQSVTVALSQEAASELSSADTGDTERLPPGIRPEFAYRPTPYSRLGYGRARAAAPGRSAIDLMHDKLMQDSAPPKVICNWDPYRWMHTSLRDE
jgi:hypothetical protein